MKKYSVGVIGCGHIARKAHLPNIASKYRLTAVSDVSADRAEAAKNDFNAEYAFDDYKKLLALKEIDSVHICTPNYLHVPIALEALEAGKHVLVEKPLAINAEDAALVFAEAEKRGLKAMSANCYRYITESAIIKSFVDRGLLGDIYYVNVKALRRRGIPPYGAFTNKELQGGGPLIDIGVHQLDLAMYLLNNPRPLRVTGYTCAKIGNTPGHAWADRGKWDPEKYEIEDLACGFVHLEGGAVLNVETAFAANIKEDVFCVSLMGTKGGADTKPLRIYTEDQEVLLDAVPAHLSMTNIYAAEIDGFYKAVEEDSPVPVRPGETVNVLKIIDGIYRSAEEQREILLQ
ncbi:MAG: Gfo/Idh/MocA family oxidoreductase [Abditibacteriota bacterium]|nr:Gfo/Idh/MocA family oxidoreductase [Abditibacteriota bacterium]